MAASSSTIFGPTDGYGFNLTPSWWRLCSIISGGIPVDHAPDGVGFRRTLKQVGQVSLGREHGSMSEERTEQQRQQQDSPLQTERGGTRIEDSVVSKIAGIAAQEVDGVRMGAARARRSAVS